MLAIDNDAAPVAAPGHSPVLPRAHGRTTGGASSHHRSLGRVADARLREWLCRGVAVLAGQHPDRAQAGSRRPDQRIPQSGLADAKRQVSTYTRVLAQHTILDAEMPEQVIRADQVGSGGLAWTRTFS